MQNWHDVPIMPQATAGQEYKPNLYSYVAKATLDQAEQYYIGKVAALGIVNAPATSYGGSGSQATHSVIFYSYDLTILINSYDNDSSHLTVVISRYP
jgi:hypothetical protein